MNHKNLYTILEISREATEVEIKRAYRRLALKYHPDTNDGGDEAIERFREINDAYSILGDHEKRRDYDLNGYAYFKESYVGEESFGFYRRGRGRRNRSNCMGRAFEACFSKSVSGRGRAFRHPFPRYQAARGTVYDIQLTKDEALNGADRDFEISNGSNSVIIRIITPANLKDGEFLIMKQGNPWYRGRDIYFRVSTYFSD